MTETNRQLRLAKRPEGLVDASCFQLVEEPAPVPLAEGDFVVRNLVLSCDPTQRGWMARDTYLPAVKLGEVMRGGAAGRVVASRNAEFAVGDRVLGMFGWQDYALVRGGSSMPTKLPPGVPLEVAMSVLGLTGITAYFGLLEIGKPKAGETIVVSAASGAVGSVAGQIGKILGCRVVGVAGGKKKCDYVVNELGFDACIDRHEPDLLAALRAATPEGIDVYYDNTAGPILEAVLKHLNLHARIALVGLISQYNAAAKPSGPDLRPLLVKRALIQGYLYMDSTHRLRDFLRDVSGWLREGKIKYKEDVVEGLERAPRALIGLLRGENFGKMIVKVSDDPTREK